ncbi:MAG: GTPase Era [Candidatus Gracilibacteria bacterium]|nr:GTPase Era [Candidatus Gracilibacteria bacterium]
MKELNLKEILENTSDLSIEKKVGYVAIIGRPNAGKSTFINSLIGEKISITTNIPQTTRKRVLAIYNDRDSQIIFFDTPGIHKSEKDFNKKINDVAINSFKDCEIILYFIDSSREGGEEEKYIRNILEMVNKPIIKVYTKTDLEAKINIPDNENIVKISSIEKTGFDNLLEKIKSHLRVGPLFFPEEYYTKQDIYFRISEIIREKAFLHTKEELPHSIYIKVEEIEETDELLKIVAYIYTETESQKYIVVGKGGQLISQIGKEARIELEHIFEKKVFLALRAKSHKNWRKNEHLIKQILN